MFNNGETEEFLLFVCKFNMTPEASGTLDSVAKVQYLRTLVHGEALRQFDMLSSELEITTPLTVEAIILGLGS